MIKNTADLTADNLAVIAGQVAPDSIKPVPAGDHFQNMIDSGWNKIDGVTVGTATAPLIIPDMFAGLILPFGTTLNQAIQVILSAINNVSDESITMDSNAFRAIKTLLQAVGIGNTVINFEDDVTPPNYDNGNHFFTNVFISPTTLQKTFAAEKMVVKRAIATGATFRIRIMKNLTELATSATFTDGDNDVYGNSLVAGFVVPPVIAKDVAMVLDDEITVEIVCVSGPFEVDAGGVFSNS